MELREELGSEVQVHCGTGAAPVSRVAGPEDRGPGDRGSADRGSADEVPRRASLVARMDPRTTVREGQVAKVHVDLQSLHFFDQDTGQRIGERAAG